MYGTFLNPLPPLWVLFYVLDTISAFHLCMPLWTMYYPLRTMYDPLRTMYDPSEPCMTPYNHVWPPSWTKSSRYSPRSTTSYRDSFNPLLLLYMVSGVMFKGCRIYLGVMSLLYQNFIKIPQAVPELWFFEFFLLHKLSVAYVIELPSNLQGGASVAGTYNIYIVREASISYFLCQSPRANTQNSAFNTIDS